MPSTDMLKNTLAARIAACQRECDCQSLPEARFETREEVKEAIHAAIAYHQPGSVFLLLMAMKWCLEKEPPSDGWWGEVDTLLYMLNVPKTASPESWGSEISTWARENHAVIYEWLELAQTWDFVHEWEADEITQCLDYWRSVVERTTS